MKTQFIFETSIGFIGIIAVLLFGSYGGSILALLALQPFLIKKHNLDEEEKILFKKVNINSLILFFALLLPMYVFFEQKINGNVIRDIWLFLVGYIFVLAHGIIGLKFFVFNKE